MRAAEAPSLLLTSLRTSMPSELASGVLRKALPRLLTSLRIANPLADIPYDTLMKDVEEFAQEKGIEDLTENLKKGALVAQNPNRWNEIEGISSEEEHFLQQEHDHKWKHPLSLYVTIVVCSIGAAVQGWDQTGS